MAGHTKRKAALEDFARRAREAEVGETALDYIVDRIASGETFRAICKTSKPELSENAIRTELYRVFGEDVVRERLGAARRDGADSLADATIERAQAIEDKDDAQAARVEIGSLQWLAGKWNKEQYGDQRQQQGAQVQINFGSLLVQAHREIAARELTALPAEIEDAPQDGNDGDQDQAEPQGSAPQAPGAQAGH